MSLPFKSTTLQMMSSFADAVVIESLWRCMLLEHCHMFQLVDDAEFPTMVYGTGNTIEEDSSIFFLIRMR